MNRLILLIIFLLSISKVSYSQYTLDIEISPIRSNKGNLMLQLFDSTQKVIKEEMIPVKENKCLISIENLAAGKYAIRYYHDENMNGKMDTNLFGKPTEGYGFSNNVTGKFGPPPFEKWLFEVSGDKKITLKPTY
jgi:uncharacterized protein (DUF2141 family)